MYRILIAIMMSTTGLLLAHKTNTTVNRNYLGLAGLPEYNPLFHNILSKKLELLNIHGEYLQNYNKAFFSFIQIWKEEEKINGSISDDRYMELVRQTNYPEKNTMRSELERLSSDPYVGYKTKYCLELIHDDNSLGLLMLFDLLFKEIQNDIDNYEKSGIDLSQFRSKLEVYYYRSNFMIVE